MHSEQNIKHSKQFIRRHLLLSSLLKLSWWWLAFKSKVELTKKNRNNLFLRPSLFWVVTQRCLFTDVNKQRWVTAQKSEGHNDTAAEAWKLAKKIYI